MQKLETDRAWIHRCGAINPGTYVPGDTCGSCRFDTHERAIEFNTGEVVRVWLFPDSGAAERDATPTTLAAAERSHP